MKVPWKERGAALLAVLLLVAVTGAIAAAAMEKLRLSRAVAANAYALDQARAHANGIAELALLTIDDLQSQDRDKTTLAGGWQGSVRQIPLPDGGLATVQVRDGGNCFSLNSVVEGDPRTRLARRNTGVAQFAGLMLLIGVGEGEARRIAEAAADWADSDSLSASGGAEDTAYGGGAAPFRVPNTLFADVGEARGLAGMTPEIFAALRPWLCALPVANLSPLNVNTLTEDQAPLLAMLAPGQIDVARARRIIAARPAAGWDNMVDFWRTESLSELAVPMDAQLQPQVKSSWFALDVRVALMGAEFAEDVLVDARMAPVRLSARSWRE